MAQLLASGNFHPECQLRHWMGKEKALDFPSTLARRENCFPGPCTHACPNLFPKLGKENHMMRLISQPFVLPQPECDSADTEGGWGRDGLVCFTTTTCWPATTQAERDAVNKSLLKPGSTTWTPGPLPFLPSPLPAPLQPPPEGERNVPLVHTGHAWFSSNSWALGSTGQR